MHLPDDYKEGDKIEMSSLGFSRWNLEMIMINNALRSNLSGKGVKIGIIDTGYAPHENLKEPVKTFSAEFPDTLDENGHGTHVYGIIHSIAPDADYYIAKGLGKDGNGTRIEDCIRWCVLEGCDIINLSLGSNKYIDDIAVEVRNGYQKGIVFVGAAGNYSGNKIMFPASMDEFISVGAVDMLKRRANFSQKGTALDIMSPGVAIVSTWINNEYKEAYGTSMATPHVSGICAIIIENLRRQSLPNYPDAVKKVLYYNAEDLEFNGWDERTGNGLGLIRFDSDKPKNKKAVAPIWFKIGGVVLTAIFNALLKNGIIKNPFSK
jgi:subtilisin family serine protease